MRVLVIGGAGFVGTLTAHFLRQNNWIRVLDLVEPEGEFDDFMQGSCLDIEDVRKACEGMEGLIYMPLASGESNSADSVHLAYDVNVKGMYLALFTAKEAGVGSVVYLSTLDVYQQYGARYLTSEAEYPPDSTTVYGLTKWLGEEVCRNFGQYQGMKVTTLRLCGPMSHEEWISISMRDGYTVCTAAPDVASAINEALHRKTDGYDLFFISGDYEERTMSLDHAREMLGWEPLVRANPTRPLNL